VGLMENQPQLTLTSVINSDHVVGPMLLIAYVGDDAVDIIATAAFA